MPSSEPVLAPADRTALTGPSRVLVGGVEHVARVGDQLLVVGWHGDRAALPGIDVPLDPVRVDARVLFFPRTAPVQVPDGVVEGGVGFLCALSGDLPGRTFVLGLGRVAVVVSQDALRDALVDVRALAWEGLAGIDPESRRQAAAFLAGVAPPPRGHRLRRQVAEDLQAVHETLREPLPGVVIDPAQPRGLFIDQLYAVDETCFYVRGWVRDVEAEVTSLVMVSPEGARAEISGSVQRYPRPDVDLFYAHDDPDARTGFLGCFELGAPSRLDRGWRVELRNAEGVALEAPVPTVVDDPTALRNAVLGDLGYDPAPLSPFLRAHAYPALSRLVARRGLDGHVAGTYTYGTPPADPDVTVLVPLYKRIDFVEHQLAQFCRDPELRGADLVYVLDSPELGEEAVRFCEGLSRMYDVPFRLVVLRSNLGFADANNVGASFARGRLLLLLNSDVLPDRPGWLGTLAAAHDRVERVGCVGAKLLYEDDSLQHAGMCFDRPEGAALWTNGHFFKGLHRSFPPANVARPVPGVTGACLMLATALYREVGGLGSGYLQGDYEDSDLCLRLLARGLENWYVPEAELYHLEGQSYPDELRRAVGRYNTWLQTHLWDAQVSEAMRAYGTPPALPPGRP